MKKYLLTVISCVWILFVYSQGNQWSWIGGENNYRGVSYGTRGIADTANRPGGRSGAAMWKDTSGNLWIFGGTGSAENISGSLNDLWKYNLSTKLWTWVGGDSTPNQKAIYGTRGTASSTNKPGAFNNAVSWEDASGNFWLYSNVLWKYNPYINQWTWVNGDTAVTRAVYGVKGVADAANKPGIGISVEWTDASGNFLLYGNVLWKYDPLSDMWTWINGDTVNSKAVYGLKGLPNSTNTPGTRTEVTGWSDTSGKLWLFGGFGTVGTPYMYRLGQYFYTGDLNDLWTYDLQINQWTWVGGDTILYGVPIIGTLGTAATGNRPGARSDAVSWTDKSGNLWLFGGYQYTSFSQPNYRAFNDLWKYDPLNNLWTCFNNSSYFLSSDIFDAIHTESPNTRPATRYGAAVCTDSSHNLWMFGGVTYDYQLVASPLRMNDLLKFNPAMNMWSMEYKNNDGRQLGIYGTKGVAGSANMPGGRMNATGSTDADGNFWLFGGQGYSSTGIFYNDLNDLWKRDAANRWTWMSGSYLPVDYPGNTFEPNVPSVRSNALTWMDANNKLWLFSGTSVYGNLYNDLWSFDNITTGQWILKNGNSVGYYGVKGQPADANRPKGRYNATNWSDKQGRLWMFGGNGNSISTTYSEYNDVWNFDPATNQWTWISGDSTAGQSGVYGNKGIPDAGNKPGARQGAVSWLDNSGNVWIFGGFNMRNGGRFLNDLWKYNTLTNVWTWVSGDSTFNQKGVYGTMGLPHADNKPGARYDALNWMDASGKLWLFGGVPAGGSGILGNQSYFYNDLWKYDPVTNLWTCISGDSTFNAGGLYGSIGIPANSNKPGARSGAVGWKDQSGAFRMMGGIGYGWKGTGFLNDVWNFSPALLALPVGVLTFSAYHQNGKVVLSWSTTDEQHGAYYAVYRSRDGISYDSIGTVSAKNGNPHDINSYQFTDDFPYQQINYYRLKQVDIDGRYTYSTVKKVAIEVAVFSYALVNPVVSEVFISLQSDKNIKAQLVVRDAAGHLVASQQLQIFRGSSTHAIPVQHLPAGPYFLTITSGKTSITKTFIKH